VASDPIVPATIRVSETLAAIRLPHSPKRAEDDAIHPPAVRLAVVRQADGPGRPRKASIHPTDKDGGETGAQARPPAAVHAFLLSSDGLAVAKYLPRLSPELRRAIVTLIRLLAKEHRPDEDLEVS